MYPAPPLGKGLKLRPQQVIGFSQNKSLYPEVDWMEVAPENYLNCSHAELDALLALCEDFPIVFHSISLSVCSPERPDPVLVKHIKKLGYLVSAKWFSDHLCVSRLGHHKLNTLLPVPMTPETIRVTIDNISYLQDAVGIAFAVENPTFYFSPPGSTMIESEFITEIVETSQCGLILDINNVVCNQINLHHVGEVPVVEQNIRDFLRHIPLSSVYEVHVAGYTMKHLHDNDLIFHDTHGQNVSSLSRDALCLLHREHKIETLLLERESNVPLLTEVHGELVNLWHTLYPKQPKTVSFLAETSGLR